MKILAMVTLLINAFNTMPIFALSGTKSAAGDLRTSASIHRLTHNSYDVSLLCLVTTKLGQKHTV